MNRKQRRAQRAARLKAQEARRRAAAEEMRKLPKAVRDLLKGHRELEETIERKKQQGGD